MAKAPKPPEGWQQICLVEPPLRPDMLVWNGKSRSMAPFKRGRFVAQADGVDMCGPNEEPWIIHGGDAVGALARSAEVNERRRMVSYRSAYCDKRADEVAAKAKAAKLKHERERALRSEAVWRAMAESARNVEASHLAKPDAGSD